MYIYGVEVGSEVLQQEFYFLTFNLILEARLADQVSM